MKSDTATFDVNVESNEHYRNYITMLMAGYAAEQVLLGKDHEPEILGKKTENYSRAVESMKELYPDLSDQDIKTKLMAIRDEAYDIIKAREGTFFQLVDDLVKKETLQGQEVRSALTCD